MDHFGTKGGFNSGGRPTLWRPEKGGQESYAYGMKEFAVDIRGHLEVSGSEDSPEVDTHSRSSITKYIYKAFPSSNSGGQDMQGD